MLKNIKSHWKRAVSGLLAVVMAAGMLPVSAFATDSGGNPYVPTGSFELNVAGATGWNGSDSSLAVYRTENGTAQATTVPTATAFALLEDNGGNRLKIGYVAEGGWTGADLDGTGWVDKDSVLVNLPDVIPSITYDRDSGKQFSSRLTRFEYVIPGTYALAEQLAQLQQEAMTSGETLVVRQSSQTVSVNRAKGDPEQLHSYTLDGVTYWKYNSWTEYESQDDSLSDLRYELLYAIDQAYSADPSVTLTRFCPQTVYRAPAKVSASDPTGGVGAYNPGSPGGKKPTTSDVDWRTDPERTFLRFTLIEFPNGVVTDLNTNDYSTWHVVGTPLNVVWSNGWSADKCRSDITWYNSCAMQYNGKGADAAQLMAGSSVAQGVYSYDATAGHNKRWVTTADEFQTESGITDQQKEQMFHCNSNSWASGWKDGDYTSMWGTDAESVTPGNLYKVYKANDAFLYLLGRLSEQDNQSGGDVAGWSKDEAMEHWSEYIHDVEGNLRTKYRVIVETGGVFRDPDGVRRAYTLREMMAYSIYNSESQVKGNLIWDQASTMVNMARWMRQGKDNQFLEYPLNEDGTPTGEELHSTNGFRECDSYVDTIQYPRPIRDTIFSERRSFGLHIFSPFNFETADPAKPWLQVTKQAGEGVSAGDEWAFTVKYTAGAPIGFTAKKNDMDCTSQVTQTGNGLKFTLKAGETIRIDFDADSTFRCEVMEDDSSKLTGITGTGGTADMTAKKFTTTSGVAKVTFTNGTIITEKKPVYLKLKKIAATDKRPLSGAEFAVYTNSSCSGTPLAVMTTGADGTASTSVPNIVEDGGTVTLYVKETKAPAGCTPLASPFTVTCKAPENSTAAGAVQIGPAGGIENGGIPEPGKALLFKRDALTNTGVGPATFKFSSVTNGVYEFDTDENGVLESVQWWDPTESTGKYIKPGEYAVTELVPPPNYEPTTEVQQIKLELDANGNPIPAGPLVFKNLARVGLKIVKYDRQSHKPMANVTFEIFRDGVSLGNYETNASGEILLTGIEPGTYRAVEVDTGDDSHIKDTAPQEIELTAGCGMKELFFFNDVLPGMKLVKVDSTDPSKTIPGVKFSIRAIDGSYGPEEFITNSRGEIDLSRLPVGSYEVTELECPGYVVDNAQRIIHLRANDTAQFVFTNTKKPGFKLVKTSADGTPLDGVTFRISPIGDASHSIDRTTANGGEILVEDLEPGIYSVVETATLPNHILDTTEYHVELSPGRTSELRLSNDKKPGFRLIKTSADGTPLDGVTFRIAKIEDGGRYLDRTTANGGEIFVENLEPGMWSVTEIATLPDHVLDTTEHHVELFPNKTSELRLSNDKKPLLTLAKIDADSGVPIPNTVFTVKALDGTYQDDWKTGPDGKVSQIVDPGVYEVTEKSVPAPYYLPDKDADRTQTITLSPNDEKTLTFRNRKAPELTIFKENSITGEAIEHAKFHITYTSNGEAAEAPATIDYGEVFTDSRGEIKVHELGKRLYPGEFTITEVEPADGFQLKEPLTQTVIIHGNESKTVRFQNTPLSALVVWKYDSVTGAPVEGCIFQVKYMSGTSGTGGTVIGTYKTGPGGSFTINRLKAGAYTVEELASDGDHVMDTAPQTAYISGEEQAVVQLYFGNSPKGAVLIKKIDSVTHEPLSDCEFFITDSNGTMLGDANGKFVTDSAGTILISNIDPGTTIVARETRAKENYILDDVPQTATIKAGQTVSLEFRNQPKGSVTLYKFSSVDRKTPLEGVGFKITYADGKVVDNIGGKLSSNGIYYTDSEGQINISGVTGTLIFTEVSTIPGYLIDENRKSQTIVVNPDDHQSVYFYNQPVGSILVKKMSSTTKEPLSDVIIRITRTDGSVVGTSNGEFRTDENGFIKVDVEPGSYIVQEVSAKPGFLLDDTPKVVEVKGSGVYNVELFNQPLGSLVIHKYSSLDRKTPLAGVQFKVAYAPGCVVDDENGKVSSNGIYYTGPDGTITINGIVGTVTITEQATIPGYTIDPETRSQTIVVNPDDVQHAYFYNSPKNTLIIEKHLETESGNEPLKGVTFMVTDSSGAVVGNSNGEFITGDDGRVVIAGVEPGTTVNVQEIKVPEGVVLDSIPKSIKISDDGANILRFYNKKTGYLVVRKLDSITKQPLAGVEFELTYADGSYVDDAFGHLSSKGRFVTNDAGEIRVPVVGTIVVKEVKTLPTHVIDQATQIQTVKVNPADTQTITVYNEPLCSLTLRKVDATTGKPVPNTEFTLKDGNGTVLGRYTTGADGTVTVTGLMPNSTIVVVESKVPSNYVLDPTPRTIIVRNGNNSVASGGTSSGGSTGTTGGGNTGTVGGGNDLTVENMPKTTLTIEKYLETDAGNVPLKGVTFLVTDSSGAILGPNNGEYTTDENGRIVLPNLEPGTVITAKELRVPDGVVLDGTPKSIEIKGGMGGQTLTFVNKSAGGLELIKVNEADKSQRILNVTFEIRRMDGGLVDTITTDKQGRAYLALDAGDYYAVEIDCPSNFKLDATPHYFTIQDGKATTLTVTNKEFSGILIHKVDSTTKKGIYGVSFLLYDSTNTPIGQYTSDNSGYVYIEGLTKSGRYYLRELENKGYIPDTQMKTVYVTVGETTLVEWENTPITGQIQITKKSADYNPTNGLPAGTLLEGAIFEIYDKAGNLVDTIRSDSRGLAVSKPLPLNRYTIREVKAPDNYGISSQELTAYLEHEGQIVRFEVTNKALTTGVSITKTGPAEIMAGQPVRYTFSNIGNHSNVRLDSFYWRDVLPAEVRLDTVVTGTYNFPGTYKITYRVNGGEPRTLADNLSTSKNYTLAASAAALGLASNERVTEVMFVFGQAPGGFAQVEKPMLYCTAVKSIATSSFVNVADVGGVYNGRWVQAISRWVTKVYGKPVIPTLPRTGY